LYIPEPGGGIFFRTNPARIELVPARFAPFHEERIVAGGKWKTKRREKSKEIQFGDEKNQRDLKRPKN